MSPSLISQFLALSCLPLLSLPTLSLFLLFPFIQTWYGLVARWIPIVFARYTAKTIKTSRYNQITKLLLPLKETLGWMKAKRARKNWWFEREDFMPSSPEQSIGNNTLITKKGAQKGITPIEDYCCLWKWRWQYSWEKFGPFLSCQMYFSWAPQGLDQIGSCQGDANFSSIAFEILWLEVSAGYLRLGKPPL